MVLKQNKFLRHGVPCVYILSFAALRLGAFALSFSLRLSVSGFPLNGHNDIHGG
jgi:hypothetical protein